VEVRVRCPQASSVRRAELVRTGTDGHAEHGASGGDVHPSERSVGVVHIIGVDIGGTGIKGAPVDIETGELVAEKVRILTPQPATPEAVAEVVADVVSHFPDVGGPVGCAFPAVVKRGVTLSAANVDQSWIGLDADALFTERLGREVHMMNDADAAGLAEVELGVAKDRAGVVLLVTLGTGIGTALFVDGVLVPNTELGHIELNGMDAEDYASEKARIEADISWKKYAARLDEFLAAMEALVNPDLIVLGGGGSKKADKFLPLLDRTCEVVPAEMRNEAGIVGAALVGTGRGQP
jgi:polyphosphate glucokinase